MKNILIMGYPRTGSSVLTNIMRDSGYYVGKDLKPANEFNPKGFYEDIRIKLIIENIFRESGLSESFQKNQWFFNTPMDFKSVITEYSTKSIMDLTEKSPYAFKFGSILKTIHTWDGVLDDVIFICCFRRLHHISQSTKLIMNNGYPENSYMKTMSYKHFNDLVQNNYLYALSNYQNIKNKIVFVDYNDIVTKNKSTIKNLSETIDCELKLNCVDPLISKQLSGIYNEIIESELDFEIYNSLSKLKI